MATTTRDVLEILAGADGDYDDGLDAHVSVRITSNVHAFVELIQHGKATTYRVTVEKA